jgi:UDP-glucose 4-epimerase
VEAERRNARGTLQVLEAARAASVGRVIYASTIWAYSDTPADCHDESLALHPPAHLYTATKLAGEYYCHSYHELYGVSYTILRFGIPYGPRARPAAVVPAFVARALAGEPLKIAGDGSQSRRFVYVEDLARGVVAALAPVAENRTYNLVGTVDTSIREIAEAVRDVVGDVAIEFTPGRTGDFAGAPVSAARAQDELGWHASTPFEEGLRRYVAWVRSAAPAGARRRFPLAALARRSAIAFGWAALVGVLIVGLATLFPVDGDMDVLDTFVGVIILALPVVLAGGFAWETAAAGPLRVALWTGAVASLAIAISPWHLVHGHGFMLALFAVASAAGAQLVGLRSPLEAWLGFPGE